MCFGCIYRGKKELRQELHVLTRDWRLMQEKKAIPMAKVLADSLSMLHRWIGKTEDPRLCEHDSVKLDEQIELMGKFAKETGGAHYVIRVIMSIPKQDFDEVTKALVIKTRRLMDFFYSCLRMQEPPTLDMETTVQDAMEHFKEHLIRKGALQEEPEAEEILH